MRDLPTPPAWMQEQIHADLAGSLPAEMKRDALDRFLKEYQNKNDPWLLARVVIRKNHILTKQYYIPTETPWEELRRVRLDMIVLALKRLAQCVKLPNVDFILSLSDSFDINTPIPVFGFAKNPHIAPRTILMPDFEALMGNENYLQAVRSGNEQHPWPQKRNRAIFRGSLTGGSFNEENFLEFPRSRAITWSLFFPDLIDARFVASPPGWEAFKQRFNDYFGASMSIEEQVGYKYQLLIDGNSCAYSRAYWQLFSNGVILKQSSDNIQWYYRAILPFVHYIPVKTDMSDLPEMIEWAQSHDAEAQKISSQAQDFAKNNLSYARIMQYLYLLLVEYAARQNQ